MAGFGQANCAPTCYRRAQWVPGKGRGASMFPTTSLSREAAPEICVNMACDKRICDRVPVVDEDHGRPCWPRKGIECRVLDRARFGAGQPNPVRASRTAGKGICRVLVTAS